MGVANAFQPPKVKCYIMQNGQQRSKTVTCSCFLIECRKSRIRMPRVFRMLSPRNYLMSGHWSEKARNEAHLFGKVHQVAVDPKGALFVPRHGEAKDIRRTSIAPCCFNNICLVFYLVCFVHVLFLHMAKRPNGRLAQDFNLPSG